MQLLEVAGRPDRHADLLDVAESLGPTALIYFERGGEDGFRRGNEMALAIQPAPSGDIGWQIVDVGIMLTRHAARLAPATRAHLALLLEQGLGPWADRDFGRGNVNHPVIATWLYAAAATALGRPELSLMVDARLARFMTIFSRAGDMSEYNSPTYLGPTLIGLANIGTHAELPSARLRARLIEERIWLSALARWHAPAQQLAGPHSRAYADSTLGFGGVFRYLAHAVLSSPVFWDTALAQEYDHHHDAEWATKIAASTFAVPDYLCAIAEKKEFPYTVESDTDGEDYTVDGREVYRGGWSRLTTYMTSRYSLGSAERPYVDGGQTENCIAFWQRRAPVRGAADVRALYFRYVANERLPGSTNVYHGWYSGREMTYSPNLLHQDGRQHVLQHGGKAILLAQPLRRENGHYRALRFDTLLPLFTPLDELWIGDRPVASLPLVAGWEQPVLLRDGELFAAIRPLCPTDLGGAEPALQVAEVKRHLIISIYNLRGAEPRSFAADVLNLTRNGLILELGSAEEYGDFTAFRRHIEDTSVTEKLWLGETREVCYRSGPDELVIRYNSATQEVLRCVVNGRRVPRRGFRLTQHAFHCRNAAQGARGRLQVTDATLYTDPGIPAWLAYEPASRWAVAVLPTELPSRVRLATPWGSIECDRLRSGRIGLHASDAICELEVDALEIPGPLYLKGIVAVGQVRLNGEDASGRMEKAAHGWTLR